MEISDTFSKEDCFEVTIDNKGRFILPKKIYNALVNGNSNYFFMMGYDWDNKKFNVLPPKKYKEYAKSLDSNNCRIFCSNHFGAYIMKGRRINLSPCIKQDYCRDIKKERPDIGGKSAKVSWKKDY